jgi:hypothetical protein
MIEKEKKFFFFFRLEEKKKSEVIEAFKERTPERALGTFTAYFYTSIFACTRFSFDILENSVNHLSGRVYIDHCG